MRERHESCNTSELYTLWTCSSLRVEPLRIPESSVRSDARVMPPSAHDDPSQADSRPCKQMQGGSRGDASCIPQLLVASAHLVTWHVQPHLISTRTVLHRSTERTLARAGTNTSAECRRMLFV